MLIKFCYYNGTFICVEVAANFQILIWLWISSFSYQAFNDYIKNFISYWLQKIYKLNKKIRKNEIWFFKRTISLIMIIINSLNPYSSVMNKKIYFCYILFEYQYLIRCWYEEAFLHFYFQKVLFLLLIKMSFQWMEQPLLQQ